METTKLTLEHLSVYLPYGLKVKCNITKIFKSDRLLQIDGLQSIDGINLISLTESIKRYDVMLFKPILKPLSYYTEALIKTVGISTSQKQDICALANKNINISHLEFRTIIFMAKEHIDMFNLIPAGLAINYFETI